MDILKFSESELFDFIAKHSEGVHIKEVSSGKYIFANEKIAKAFGLKNPLDIIGFTARDIDKFMQPYWGKDYVAHIEKMDFLAGVKGEIAKNSNEIFLNGNRHVYKQDIIKIPYKNSDNKIVAIITLTNDLTKDINLFSLFDLYLKMHATQELGVKYFLNYLDVEQFFYQDLTAKEVGCLLAMKASQLPQIIACNIKVTVSEAENLISGILEKMKIRNLNAVLSML